MAFFLRSTSDPRDRRQRPLAVACRSLMCAAACVAAMASVDASIRRDPGGAYQAAVHQAAVYKPGEHQAGAQQSGLDARLVVIRTAFLSNNPDQVVRCFARDRPVFVRMSPLDRGALLRPGPLDAFIRGVLSRRVSIDFTIGDGVQASAAVTRAFATATWTYRSSASSTLQVDRLHLVLSHAPEHAEWLIVEMKTPSR